MLKTVLKRDYQFNIEKKFVRPIIRYGQILHEQSAEKTRIVDIGGLNAMNFIKLILMFLGLIFGVMLFFWLFGLVTSLIWYGFWIAVIAAVGYGGYKLFL